jgi:3-deoxy-7-phosphoheptulonate synthase
MLPIDVGADVRATPQAQVAGFASPPTRMLLATGTSICWICDPMHANTHRAADGHKTRHLDDITAEIQAFFAACRRTDTMPAGLHLETSPDDITECIGGWQQLDETDLTCDYQTHCDPRLNDIQTMNCVTVALQELARQPDSATTTAKQLAPRTPTQPTHIGEDELANLGR